MAYFGYTRVSTKSQAERGGGLDVQRSQIEEYAAAHGYHIEQIFSDEGVSGTKETRGGLDELVSSLSKGDFVIIQNTNRLWRDIFAEAAILKTFMNIGADFISIDEPENCIDRIVNDPEGALMFGVMSAIASYQRLEINRKLARGRTTKARTGWKPAGCTPYGYRYALDGKQIEVDPGEAPAVKRMFSLAQSGKSLQQIADAMNKDGVKTRRENAWSAGSVRAVLRNPFYTGTLTHQGKEIAGNHAALISKVQYGKVGAALERRHR